MGTIIPRKRKDGTTGYQAQVMAWRDGKPAHRETRTFDRRPAATAWIAKREEELASPAGLEAATRSDPALSAVIDRYTTESLKAIGRTKAQVLLAIKRHDIATKRCSTIGSADVVAFANELAARVAPQTVGNYLSHLQSVFAIARPAWGYPLDLTAIKDAVTVAKRLGLTTRSRERDRRPTLPELDKLMEHFGNRQVRRADAVPMQQVIAFAIFSTRRQEEITRLRRDDLDRDGSRIKVRDMKNPGDKAGNDVWTDLTPEALSILDARPKGDLFFPYSTDAISAGFTRACRTLGIEDLHFHDLRHDGVSRLFELGWNIPHVATVSGHRNWTSLRRYTHLRQAGDKYTDWKWLAVAKA